MAGATPFFVTAAAAAGGDQRADKRKRPDAVGIEQLQDALETLAGPGDAVVPLGDVRDLFADHWLETIETDLKYTVLLVCEEVSDLRVVSNRDEAADKADADANDGDNKQQEAVATTAPAPTAETSDEMPFLSGTEDFYRLKCRLSDGDSIPRSDSTLLRVPVSQREMEKEKKSAKKAIKMKIKKFKKGGGDRLTAAFYVLSADELRVHLPMIPFGDAAAAEAAEFITTRPLPDGDTRSEGQLLLALDCEMCRTTKGVELTRITLVDAKENVLIDEYVRPKNPIVDYCTQYSGITYDIMESTTTTLADVQKLFLQHVPEEAILVGHSIENDLMALRVLHRRIIDTTVLYPHPKGPPFRSALRFLASQFLKKTIQTGTDGHCSIEDAVATLQLVHLKIKHGPTFPSIEHEYKQKKVLNELAKLKKSALLVDGARACRSLSAGTACAIPSETPPSVATAVVHQLTTGFPPHLTWARMRGATRGEIAQHVRSIRAALPERSCLMVVLAGDTTELRAQHKLRTTRADPRCSIIWDKQHQAQLDAVAAHTQQGLVHVLFKTGDGS